MAASFHLESQFVELIPSPKAFYQAILSGINNSKQRVYLTCLYIGAEQESIFKALDSNSKRGVETKLITDFCRTMRAETSGLSTAKKCQALMDLDKVQTFMYRVPLNFPVLKWLPYRFQETLGVHHWKIYVFDDDVILTGANLAKSYFTNRVDRWIRIKNSPELANFACELIDLLQTYSHRLLNSLEIEKPTYQRKPLSVAFAEKFKTHTNYTSPKSTDTTLKFGIHCGFDGDVLANTDDQFIEEILSNHEGIVTTTVASPYMNYRTKTVNALKKLEEVLIIGASPDASSFFTGGPVLSAVPWAYKRLTTNVLTELGSRARYLAFESPPSITHQTFHVKGIWQFGVSRARTLIGSSNLGVRSHVRDFECLCILDTRDPALISRFRHELDGIKKYAVAAPKAAPRHFTRFLSSLLIWNSFVRSLL